MTFVAVAVMLAVALLGWRTYSRAKLSREVGSLNLTRDIYFHNDLVVDVANKEILMEGKWYPPKQIHHWDKASGRSILNRKPRLAVMIFTNDPGLPVFCFSTSAPKTYRRLLQALRMIGL